MEVGGLQVPEGDFVQPRSVGTHELGIVNLLVTRGVADTGLRYVPELAHEADQALHLEQCRDARGAVDQVPDGRQGAVEVEDKMRSSAGGWVDDNLDLGAGSEASLGPVLRQFRAVDVVGAGGGRHQLGRRSRARSAQLADGHRGGNVRHVRSHGRLPAAGEHGRDSCHHRIARPDCVNLAAEVDTWDDINPVVVGGDNATFSPGYEDVDIRVSTTKAVPG